MRDRGEVTDMQRVMGTKEWHRKRRRDRRKNVKALDGNRETAGRLGYRAGQETMQHLMEEDILQITERRKSILNKRVKQISSSLSQKMLF